MKATTLQVNERLRADATKIIELLIEKNTHYDNAALTPFNVFSTYDAIEKIKVRLDDKLARMRHFFQSATSHNVGTIFNSEDTIADLIGYLLLLRAAASQHQEHAYTEAVEPAASRSEVAELRRRMDEMYNTMIAPRAENDVPSFIGEDTRPGPEVVVDRVTKQLRPRRKPGRKATVTPRKKK